MLSTALTLDLNHLDPPGANTGLGGAYTGLVGAYLGLGGAYKWLVRAYLGLVGAYLGLGGHPRAHGLGDFLGSRRQHLYVDGDVSAALGGAACACSLFPTLWAALFYFVLFCFVVVCMARCGTRSTVLHHTGRDVVLGSPASAVGVGAARRGMPAHTQPYMAGKSRNRPRAQQRR